MELPFTILDKDRWSRLNHPAELMCCRVAQGSKKDRLKKKVNAKAADNNASPRLNLAPTQDAMVARIVSEEIRRDPDGDELRNFDEYKMKHLRLEIENDLIAGHFSFCVESPAHQFKPLN